MPFVKYTKEQRHEAIALARVVGVYQAGQQLGLRAETIRSWMDAAGISAGDSEIDTDELARFERLAYARMESDLVTGKTKGRTLITAWGVARDKLSRRDREAPKVDATSSLTVRDAFCDWLIDTAVPDDAVMDEPALEATLDAIEAMTGHLLRKANAESGQPHRSAMLAWHSGRADIPASDGLLAWAQGHARAVLDEHGDPVTWHAAYLVERDAQRAAWMAHADALAADTRARYSMPVAPTLSPETLALLAEADALLLESTSGGVP